MTIRDYNNLIKRCEKIGFVIDNMMKNKAIKCVYEEPLKECRALIIHFRLLLMKLEAHYRIELVEHETEDE